MSKWSGYFKVVAPERGRIAMTDSQDMTDSGAYNNFSWYQRLVQGSGSRLTRYREYDLMDNDVEVARAIDSIAEEATGNNPRTQEPIEIDLMLDTTEDPEGTKVLTIRAALTRWNKIHNWENRLYKVCRLTVKYGDAFFRKSLQHPHRKWEYIHPKNIVAAVMHPDDATNVVAWQVRTDIRAVKAAAGFNFGSKSEGSTEIVPADEIVRFTLNDDMSDSAPFGESVLRSVYRAHKQKELLEDAIIIYRVQRAPERRVFYIDVGKMPPQRVKTYLEGIKNEIKQKKIPNINGGQTEVDSVYNPQSMSEDFFFAQRPDGRGSRVETLPGGAGLGELSDLEYFQRKVWRGLRVPASYMIEQAEGGQVWNDGKVGVAYIQELRFALFVCRIQGYIEQTLDEEFKKYLKIAKISIDDSMYKLRLPEPTNFGKYRQQELDNQLLSAYSSADGIEYMSKRFALKRFLQLTDEEIIINEKMLREEKQIKETGVSAYPVMYAGQEMEPTDIGGGFGGEDAALTADSGEFDAGGGEDAAGGEPA